EPSESPYTSPAFFRKKKNNDLRLILDYKNINNYIEDDSFVLPKIDDCLQEMGENTYFSQLDLQNGFNQIRISDESRKYTSFMLLGRQYQYKRIPFGIKPGPKIFQRYITNILHDVPNCFVYIDDIVIYSKTKDEHAKYLTLVLETLLENNVRINFEKSNFFTEELIVLGYKVNSTGIYPLTNPLENEIFEREIRTRKDVQRPIGTLNWYRKFVPKLSSRIHEITNLLRKNETPIKFSEGMKKMVADIKTEIIQNAK
ncbi:Retrovirus-related Pol polyprotein from transposon opus, partial [Nosema granulosis]